MICEKVAQNLQNRTYHNIYILRQLCLISSLEHRLIKCSVIFFNNFISVIFQRSVRGKTNMVSDGEAQLAVVGKIKLPQRI